MTIDQIIGFLISMFFLVVIVLKKAFENRQRHTNPQKYEEDKRRKEETLQEFLKSLKQDMKHADTDKDEEDEDEEDIPVRAPPPKPQPVVRPQERFQPKLEGFKRQTAIEQRRLQTSIDARKLKTNVEDKQFVSSLDNRYKDKAYDVQKLSEDARVLKQDTAYEVKERDETSPAYKIIKRLRSPKELVILYEIMGKPKGLQ